MLEHRRQQYLSLLGIDNYVPTRVLAHAAPSILLPDELLIDPALLRHPAIPTQFVTPGNDESGNEIADIIPDERADDSSGVTEAASNNTALMAQNIANENTNVLRDAANSGETVGRGQQAQESKRNIDESVRALVEKPTDIELDKAITSSEKNGEILAPVKFVFSVWRVKDILILDTRKVREALPTDHLLQNILRSIGYAVAQLPVSESLRWPLFTNKKLTNKEGMSAVELTDEQYKNDVGQARAMVQAYISAQHSRSPLKYLFLMGEDVTTFTLDDSTCFIEANGSVIQSVHWDDVQCCIIPSLYSMLQDPPTKRIAWAALQSMNSNTD